MMKALDDDFTFPGQIKKTVQPGNEPQNSDDQSPENEANEQQVYAFVSFFCLRIFLEKFIFERNTFDSVFWFSFSERVTIGNPSWRYSRSAACRIPIHYKTHQISREKRKMKVKETIAQQKYTWFEIPEQNGAEQSCFRDFIVSVLLFLSFSALKV